MGRRTSRRRRVRVLAALAGATDIAPFVLSLASGASAALPHDVTGGAILLAAASNDLAKAGYALVFGDRRVGRAACLGLLSTLRSGAAPHRRAR